MNTLIINGKDYTSLTSGLKDIKVTFALNAGNRTAAYTASGIFKIHGGDLEQLMLDVSLNWDAFLTIDNKITLRFDVNARNVRVCEDGCSFEITMQEITEERLSFEKLARSLISDNEAMKALLGKGASSKMNYCFEMDWIAYLIAYVYWSLYFVINSIVVIVDLFTDEPTIKAIQWYVVGCYKYHYPLRVHDTCEHWANECNLTFQSSITSSPEHNNLYFLETLGFTGYSRRKPTPSNQRITDDYTINLTVPQLLDQLSLVFNADYRIINGVLYFERKDFFPSIAEKLRGYIDGTYCVVADPDQLVTNINFQWAADAIDNQSVKVVKHYSGRIDLNPDEYKTLRGTRDVAPRCSLSDYTYSQFGDSDLRKYRWEFSKLDEVKFEHLPIIGMGQTSEIRLMHLKKTPANTLEGVPNFSASGGSGGYPTFGYEERMRFKDSKKLPEMPYNSTLYPNYFYIDDVRNYPRYYAERIIFVPENICDTIDQIKNNSLNVYIDTPYGKAIPKEIEWDVKTGRMELLNCTIWP